MAVTRHSRTEVDASLGPSRLEDAELGAQLATGGFFFFSVQSGLSEHHRPKRLRQVGYSNEKVVIPGSISVVQLKWKDTLDTF